MSKSFEELFSELKAKAAAADPESGTVKELAKGTHFIGKKITEEAAEVWIAAEYEGQDRTAEEISQLLFSKGLVRYQKLFNLYGTYFNNTVIFT